MDDRQVVFIVDDDAASRESVSALVSSMDIPTATFESAEDFLEAYDGGQGGCLVTDLKMFGMSGVELLEEMENRGIRLPTIVMSGHADVQATVESMRRGALTLLEKPCRELELWEAIQQALRLDAAQREERQRKREILQRIESLTDQERAVMDMIVDGKPNKSIARALDVSLRTVESRRQNVYRKLGADSVAALVRLVMEVELPKRRESSYGHSASH